MTWKPLPHEKKRIVEIATALVAGRVAAGELKLKDNRAFKKAVQEAVADAVQAYRAAEEFLCG